MKKSRIIALLTAVAMIVSAVPAFAAGYFVDDNGVVYEKAGTNLIANPGFEDGLTGITTNEEYYEVTTEQSHKGAKSLKAIKSTKDEGAITAYFPVEDPNASYYLSFWYLSTDDTVARRPRVTFAFTDASKVIPEEENAFTEATNAWIAAGTASNDQDMAYSKGEWVKYSTVITGNGSSQACAYAVLNIYGLTKDVTYVDDFEVYELNASEEYADKLVNAINEWEKNVKPANRLSGIGTLDLPMSVSEKDVVVEWSCDSDAIVINDSVCEYISQEDEELVVLTARLYVEGHKNDIYYEFEYPIIVESMFVKYVEWLKNDIFEKIGNSVDSNLELPTEYSVKGYYPATITWSCSDENIIASDGTFTPPETTCSVDLIATLNCEGMTKEVTKRVKAMGGNIVADGLIMYYDFEDRISGDILSNKAVTGFAYDAKVANVETADGFAHFSTEGGEIKLPDNYATELDGSYSVSMWVNIANSMAASGKKYRFFDFGGSTGTSQFLRYIPASGQLSFMDRGTSGGAEVWALDSSLTNIGGTWKLITFTYEYGSTSSVATVYVDGVKLKDSGNNSTLTNTIKDIAYYSPNGYIGHTLWDNADNPDFVGMMDDVRIYNRAITADEIATLYSETRPTITAPVTIKFEDLDGNELKAPVTIQVDVDINYEVPASYKSLPSSADDNYRYSYKYLSSHSMDSVYVSEEGVNECTLVFQFEKTAKGENLIKNPGFETGVDGWTSNNGGVTATVTGWVRSNEIAHEGEYSLKRNSDAGSGDAQNFGTYIPIESGKKYNFSFWEYSSVDVPAGSHMMSAVCVTKDKGATNDATNQLVNEFGGYSSWHNLSTGATRDVAYAQGWNQRTFTFDTTGATNANYILVAYAWKTGGDFYIDDFVLEVVSDGDGDGETSDTYPVTVKYVDVDGNKIAEDATINIKNEGKNTYAVPDSYKRVEDLLAGGICYKYTYNDEKSTDEVSVSIINDMVATLVFDYVKVNAKNLVTDGSFEDENGNFSWGTWQSPSTGNYFKDTCEDWFYKVDADSNASVLYKTGSLTAEDYALGTRWNDGELGLCSLANFIPVSKGKTYLVTYDYKHKTAGTNASTISTTFQTTKSFSAGASGGNVPKNVSASWQTNSFEITATEDGYIYFHFSWVGSGGNTNTSDNAGNGPYWYFDNFSVHELITFENKMEYVAGYVEILAEEGTTGYVVQAKYTADGELESVVVSEKLEGFNKETPVKVEAVAGAKIMFIEELTNLKPLAPSIIAQ